MKYLAPIFVLASMLCGCESWKDGNRPGVTKEPEAAAKAAFPDVPGSEEALELRQRGKKVFMSSTCQSCHSTDSDRRNLAGPPLGGVGDRHLANNDNDPLETRRWMVKHIRDPLAFPGAFHGTEGYENAHMPPFPRIADEDMRALVEFLWSLQ